MSDIVGDLPPIGPGDGLPQVIDFLQKLRVYIQTREPQADSVGDALEKLLLRRDLVSLGVLQTSGSGSLSYTGGGGSGTGSGGADDEPDLTAPPTPANLRASSLLRGAYIEIDAPVYTVGHGNAWTNYFVAQYGGSGPLPTRENAVKVGQAAGASTMYVHAAPIGARLHIWATHVTVDGVESAVPAGGINGVQVTIGKIGTADLGDLIVQAQNLADGTVTPKKLLVSIGGGNLSQNSSFAADSNGDGVADYWAPYAYSPVGVVLSRTSGRRDGAAQRVSWSGAPWGNHGMTQGGFPWRLSTDYVVSFYARGSGSILGGHPTLAWNIYPTTTEWLSVPPLSAQWQRYAYRIRWDGSSTEPFSIYLCMIGFPDGVLDYDDVQVEEGNVLTAYAPMADEILPGRVTATEIADDSITTPKLVAGAVVTSKVAAGAITASKMVISTKSLVTDPWFTSGPEYWGSEHKGVWISTDPIVPPGCPANYAAVFSGRDHYMRDKIPVVAGEQYRVTGWVTRNTEIPNTGYIVFGFDRNQNVVHFQVYGVGGAVGWTRCSFIYTVPGGVYMMSAAPWNEQPHGGSIGSWFADLNIEKMNDPALIVDGAILAQHLSANSIAVGTAAIQNGAIVNAMIGNAAIDDAKIASLSAAKVTFGEMSGDRIAANTMHANRITAGTITGDRIVSGGIGTTQIAGGSITTDKIGVGQVTADRISVTSLRAVSANIGTFDSYTGNGSERTTLNGFGLRMFNSSNVEVITLSL